MSASLKQNTLFDGRPPRAFAAIVRPNCVTNGWPGAGEDPGSVTSGATSRSSRRTRSDVSSGIPRETDPPRTALGAEGIGIAPSLEDGCEVLDISSRHAACADHHVHLVDARRTASSVQHLDLTAGARGFGGVAWQDRHAGAASNEVDHFLELAEVCDAAQRGGL